MCRATKSPFHFEPFFGYFVSTGAMPGNDKNDDYGRGEYHVRTFQ
jgi:hypothetical protein